jgi:hypothetical protein
MEFSNVRVCAIIGSNARATDHTHILFRLSSVFALKTFYGMVASLQAYYYSVGFDRVRQ